MSHTKTGLLLKARKEELVMKEPSKMSRTAVLVEAALMVALAFALSAIPGIKLPRGGTISWFSTLPIIIFSFRHGLKWGLASATVYGILQAMQGMDSIFYVKTLAAMLLCALLDYILAYACLGFAGPIAGRFKNPTLGLVVGVGTTGLMRFVFSFFSGWIIWGPYTDTALPMWIYSLGYNATWCLPDVAIVLVAALLLSRVKALHILPQPAAVRS
ncbi:energy-coupled thiamine transporter ThiT [Ruminococcaceae bacterium OttesenSCG-928-A16]|nr:energy-coupled thiamine transporter ThiT [Ruminococcaceae bacterium OttesenSCG-928-A16]